MHSLSEILPISIPVVQQKNPDRISLCNLLIKQLNRLIHEYQSSSSDYELEVLYEIHDALRHEAILRPPLDEWIQEIIKVGEICGLKEKHLRNDPIIRPKVQASSQIVDTDSESTSSTDYFSPMSQLPCGE